MPTNPRLSINEIRRRAPLHYQARAANAWFCANFLSQGVLESVVEGFAEGFGYSGSSAIAVGEAVHREASLAIELVIKAVIAQKIEAGVAPDFVKRVRPSHDLPSLWGDAALPKLKEDERGLLDCIRRKLLWQGRYAAPSDARADIREQNSFSLRNGARYRAAISSLKEYEIFYYRADKEFWSVREQFYPML